MKRAEALTRRSLGLVAAALGIAAAAPVAPAGPIATAETVDIDVSGRKSTLYIWRAEHPRGVVVFFHGAGASPGAYGGLIAAWRAAGMTIIAPLHVDSLHHPDHDKYDLQRAFPARLMDTRASVAYAAKIFADLPIATAGHSYGSLFALVAAGAFASRFGPPRVPVKAVVAFSSPGKISLVDTASYTSLAAPLLQITGDEDVVLGAVADWHDHLYPYDTAPPGADYAWVGKGVDHLFGGAIDRVSAPPEQQAAFEEATALSTLFLRAFLFGEGEARTSLLARPDTPRGHFTHR